MTYVIAEAGVNHDGSLDRALALVDAAAAAGADAVKFQTFRAEALSSAGPHREFLRGLELPRTGYAPLLARCREHGLDFLSSPFDRESVRYLVEELQLPRLKIPSGEITNVPFLVDIAAAGRPVILSTGMSTTREIETALSLLAPVPVTLLHATSAYPAPPETLNLRAMVTLAETFRLPVGYSDHSLGLTAAIAAVALGAVVLEKHLTLDRDLPGPDHRASLDPAGFTALVTAIRETETMLGSSEKRCEEAELGTRAIARKSLTTLAPVRRGEPFTVDNLGTKRPGTGVPASEYARYLGRPAERDYVADELLT